MNSHTEKRFTNYVFYIILRCYFGFLKILRVFFTEFFLHVFMRFNHFCLLFDCES